MMENMSRRGFVGTVGMMGALGALGAGAASALAGEAPKASGAEEFAPSIEVYDRPGADKPWCGQGSADGNWTATPKEIAELGGSTMPLDELNRRRKMYVESFGDYTMEDGTVVPAVYNQMRALIDTYGFGAGNVPIDSSFKNLVANVTEEQAQAFLDMPWGQYFRPIDLYAKGGRTLEECREVCDHFADLGLMRREPHGDGICYNQAAWAEGISGYMMNDETMGDLAYEWPVAGDGTMDEYADAGTSYFHTLYCDSSLTSTGEILAYDDINALIDSNSTFALTPCSCRYSMLIAECQAKGKEWPSFADFATGQLTEVALEDGEGPRVETCVCMGDEAAFWIEQGIARPIDREEARKVLRRSWEEGFVLECTREKTGEYVCSCRDGYCNIIGLWRAVGEARGTVLNSNNFDTTSDYRITADYDTCVRCGTCEQRCPLHAITMDGEHDDETGYPQVADLCLNCGQCASVCPMSARVLVPKDRGVIMPDNLVDGYNLVAAYRFEQGMVH